MRAKLSKKERLIIVEALAEAFDKARRSRRPQKEELMEIYNLANRLTKQQRGRPDLIYGFYWKKDSIGRYCEHFQGWIKELKEAVTRETKDQLPDSTKSQYASMR